MAFLFASRSASGFQSPDRQIAQSLNSLPPIPVPIPPIPIHIPVLSPQLSSLMLRRSIISAIQIAPQLPPVLRDPDFIMANVAPVAPSIIGKHCPRTQSHHQKNSCNCPFHIRILLRTSRILQNENTTTPTELRPASAQQSIPWATFFVHRTSALQPRTPITHTQNSNTNPAVGTTGNSCCVWILLCRVLGFTPVL